MYLAGDSGLLACLQLPDKTGSVDNSNHVLNLRHVHEGPWSVDMENILIKRNIQP